MNTPAILKSDEGIVIIIALIMLALLSLIGISATTTSTVNIQVAGNERDYKQLFYLAEASAMEGMQQLSNATDTSTIVPGSSSSLSWIHDDTIANPVSFSSVDNWKTNGISSILSPNASTTVKYGADFEGVATGSSLDITQKTRLYLFTVYGYAEDNGHSLIGVGFLRRF